MKKKSPIHSDLKGKGMKMNHLTDYYKSVFVFRFISRNNKYSFRVYTIFLRPLSQEFDFLCFLRFALFFEVGLLVFALKEASFLRCLDSSYTVSCVFTGLW